MPTLSSRFTYRLWLCIEDENNSVTFTKVFTSPAQLSVGDQVWAYTFDVKELTKVHWTLGDDFSADIYIETLIIDKFSVWEKSLIEEGFERED